MVQQISLSRTIREDHLQNLPGDGSCRRIFETNDFTTKALNIENIVRRIYEGEAKGGLIHAFRNAKADD